MSPVYTHWKPCVTLITHNIIELDKFSLVTNFLPGTTSLGVAFKIQRHMAVSSPFLYFHLFPQPPISTPYCQKSLHTILVAGILCDVIQINNIASSSLLLGL